MTDPNQWYQAALVAKESEENLNDDGAMTTAGVIAIISVGATVLYIVVTDAYERFQAFFQSIFGG